MSGKHNCCYFHLEQANKDQERKSFFSPLLPKFAHKNKINNYNNKNNKIKAHIDKGTLTQIFDFHENRTHSLAPRFLWGIAFTGVNNPTTCELGKLLF